MKNADFVTILKLVKPILWNGEKCINSNGNRFNNTSGKEQYICVAIDMVTIKHRVLEEAGQKLKKLISKRLGNRCNTLRIWLSRNGIVTNLTDKNVQRHRMAWVDMMIQEFS